MESCPICKENIQYSSLGSRDAYSVKCPRCADYRLTRTALVNLRNTTLSDRQRANISGWLFENHIFEVTTRNIDWLSEIPTPSFHERADKILLGLEKMTEFAGQYLGSDTSWISIGWCINADELNEVLEYLESSSRIHKQTKDNQPIYKILPNGWSQLETLKKIGADSKQCFVAMWFDDQMQPIYDQSIAKGILDAGYKPHRVDQREYNDKIDDEIIAQIRRSRFIVADFTGHRGGVYYEAGFAKGLGLEVIWTCRKDEMKNLHFDIRQYNCIDWEQNKLEDFRIRLKNRIERVFGQGTYQV
jgi:nucleoside 2-deoxyribosyltransferase